MPWQIRGPDLGPWEAEKNGHEEEHYVENPIDNHNRLREPPQAIAFNGQEYPQDE